MSTIVGMYSNAERAVRFLRLRKGWVQAVLGQHAGVSREFISRLERGDLARMTLNDIDRVARALGASVHLQIRWRGEQLDRLIDAAHASIQQLIAETLTKLGWIVRVEVSFNHYGDRGRVDIVAFHPTVRVLLIVEIKSAIGDIQETLGRIDVKVRVARRIAAELGWTDITTVVPAIVIGDSRAARRVVLEHGSLFARFGVRGRNALAWVRRPTGPPPDGLLWFTAPAAQSRPGRARPRR